MSTMKEIEEDQSGNKRYAEHQSILGSLQHEERPYTIPNTIGRVLLFVSEGLPHPADLSLLVQTFEEVEELVEESRLEISGR